MLIHIFQIIPLTLYLSNFSKDSLFGLPFGISEFYFLTFTSVLTFLLSLKTDFGPFRNSLLFSLAALYLFLINKLYLSPSIAVLVSSIYIVTLFKIKTYHPTKTHFSSYSVLWPYFTSSVLYLFLKIGLYQDLKIALLAVNLSFASLIYFVGLKAKVVKTSRIISSMIVALSCILLLIIKELNALTLTTDIWFVTVSILSGIILFKYKDDGLSNLTKSLFKFPEATIFSYFVLLSILGSALLGLPISRASSEPFAILDVFFTAMSAVCVTGLIVLDTPVDFSFFGQSIILGLIQLGGFGIVAMSSWVLLGLNSSRMSLEQEELLKEMSGHKPSLVGMQSTIRRIVLYFLAFELLGALILFQQFLKYDSDSGQALWRAIFTSISAFCNAGFALQSDSLIPYQTNGIILITTSILIIAGGFAPLMAINLPKKIWHGKLNLQEKLVVGTTAILLAIGFLYFTIVEWNHSLGNLPFFDKLVNSWFQSVTTRTAGFNSVDFSDLASSTPFFFLLLMFIGGNPGGTAGGIKTITFAVIFLSGYAGIRGESYLRIFNRHISSKSIFRTLAIFIVAFATVSVAFFMLNATQSISTTSILFETVSAIGTVGLSIGATASLDEVGKILIILCMLLGRVGPIAFIMLLFRNKARTTWKVPKEDIYIS